MEPLARNRVRAPAMSTATWSSSADCICDATARFQTSSYNRCCSALRYRTTLNGVRDTSVGRTASCASWAFLALLVYSRAVAGT